MSYEEEIKKHAVKNLGKNILKIHLSHLTSEIIIVPNFMTFLAFTSFFNLHFLMNLFPCLKYSHSYLQFFSLSFKETSKLIKDADAIKPILLCFLFLPAMVKLRPPITLNYP